MRNLYYIKIFLCLSLLFISFSINGQNGLIIKRVGAPTLCEVVLADNTDPLATQDCDAGGHPNADECMAGQDPYNPSDDVSCLEVKLTGTIETTYEVGNNIVWEVELCNCGNFDSQEAAVPDPLDPMNPRVVTNTIPAGGCITYTYTAPITHPYFTSNQIIGATLTDVHGVVSQPVNSDNGITGDSEAEDGNETGNNDASMIYGQAPTIARIESEFDMLGDFELTVDLGKDDGSGNPIDCALLVGECLGITFTNVNGFNETLTGIIGANINTFTSSNLSNGISVQPFLTGVVDPCLGVLEFNKMNWADALPFNNQGNCDHVSNNAANQGVNAADLEICLTINGSSCAGLGNARCGVSENADNCTTLCKVEFSGMDNQNYRSTFIQSSGGVEYWGVLGTQLTPSGEPNCAATEELNNGTFVETTVGVAVGGVNLNLLSRFNGGALGLWYVSEVKCASGQTYTNTNPNVYNVNTFTFGSINNQGFLTSALTSFVIGEDLGGFVTTRMNNYWDTASLRLGNTDDYGFCGDCGHIQEFTITHPDGPGGTGAYAKFELVRHPVFDY